MRRGGPGSAADVAATATAEVARLVQPTNRARRDALLAVLDAHGLTADVRPFTRPDAAAGASTSGSVEPRDGANVVVSLGNGDGRIIVVGAHYDAMRLADGRLSGAVVDNAANVIALVQVADSLRRRPLRHRVQLVFFDMEEQGLHGSRAFVAAADTARLAAMLNLDVGGTGEALLFAPAAGPTALVAAVRATCGDRRLVCVDFPQLPPGDDLSFRRAGVPTVTLAVVPRTDAYQFWLMTAGGSDAGLRPGYAPHTLRTIHTPADALAQLHEPAVALAATAVLDLVLRLDRTLPR